MSWQKVGVLGAVIAVALTAYAVGAGSNSSKPVVLCAAKKGGDLALASHGKCGKKEKRLTIAQQGPAGAPGAPGAPGTTTTLSTEPAHPVTPSTNACATQPGSFCNTDPSTCWDMGNAVGLALTAYRKDSAGFVHLTGSVQNTAGGGACGSMKDLFYLPPGFRVGGGAQQFAVPNCSGENFARLTVAADGLVSVTFGGEDCWSLDGVTFHADG